MQVKNTHSKSISSKKWVFMTVLSDNTAVFGFNTITIIVVIYLHDLFALVCVSLTYNKYELIQITSVKDECVVNFLSLGTV